VDIGTTAELPQALAARLVQTQLRLRAVQGLAGVLQVQVPEHGAGILWVDGKVERLLAPGSYAFWKFNRHVAVELVDLRLQALEVTGQEILTRDKVALRLNLSATWRYSDVLQAYRELAKPADHLYRELQFGLRAAVGTRSLDELLENKTVIDEVVTAQVQAKLAGYGLQLDGVGVKDIVLPGEMKTILAQVVEAGKSAEANVIRRREETAATRSLLNTAKVMEDNPVALRLKELETLERVAERIDKISVFGGLDQVLNGLVKLR
jgi:regulator of protease activity HflC (stomatin/prohibitin superfamily)